MEKTGVNPSSAAGTSAGHLPKVWQSHSLLQVCICRMLLEDDSSPKIA